MCGVIFQNRFNSSIQLVKKYIDQNKFGKLVNISISLLWCRYQIITMMVGTEHGKTMEEF